MINKLESLNLRLSFCVKIHRLFVKKVIRSWTETHTGTYFFERLSSDKTNADYNKWKSNNKGKNSTSAVSTFTIDVPSETEYSFDWTVSSESFDKLTITYNGSTIVNRVSGTKNGTQKVTLKSGMNTLKATYSKDSSSASGDDCATITLPKILIKNDGCKNKQTGEILDHNYDKGKITKEVTCTENGEKLFTCKKCGNTKTEVINKLGHNFVNDICTNCGLNMPVSSSTYCIYYSDGELVISQNQIEPESGRTVEKQGFYSYPFMCTTNMTTVKFEGTVRPKSCNNWFERCNNLIQIKNIENLYTDKCTNMKTMFYNCSSLRSIDMNVLDTSKVTDMNGMFYNCSSLESLDMSKCNTDAVYNMSQMFKKCDSLRKIYVSQTTYSKIDTFVKDYGYQFENYIGKSASTFYIIQN